MVSMERLDRNYDCIANKIEGFTAELSSPSVPDDEKLLALKFLTRG